MPISLRQYHRAEDFRKVSDFLIRHFTPGNRDGNWLQPVWEYMHSHPSLDEVSLEEIGIWEEADEIVGVAHYETRLGEAFFQVHPEYASLKPEMLTYAEAHLHGIAEDGKSFLRAYVNDFDVQFEALVKAQGYVLDEHYTRPLYQLPIPDPFLPVTLPNGFRLKSLAEENDLSKVNRVLWRGFNHPGEPPNAEIEGRRKMQSTPNFRKDLTIVVEAPRGDFVAFAGAWFEGVNKIAYVEPVATDPDYRRMGLGRAAILEGLRRCAELGARVAYVGSDLEFYKSMGFEKCFDSRCWVKERFRTSGRF